MGLLLSRVLELFAGNRNYRILMVGLDAAGKTTLLYKLKLDELVTTIPTIGFNVETVSYGNINFTVWDIGGQDRIRTLWRHYFQNTDAVIFVVDSNDLDRISEAKYELTRIMEDSELTAKYLLVYANKQDLPSALTDVQIADRLSLSSLHNITWHVQASNAISGDGIYEGLQWISQQLKA